MNDDIVIETHKVIAEVYGIIDCDINELNATVEIHFTADATTVIDEAFRGDEAWVQQWIVPDGEDNEKDGPAKKSEFSGWILPGTR